jgi:hypothetical protein
MLCLHRQDFLDKKDWSSVIIMIKEKNNKKYSIPIYENGIKTKWTIDGIKGDEKYFELLKYGNGKDLPDMVNFTVKK